MHNEDEYYNYINNTQFITEHFETLNASQTAIYTKLLQKLKNIDFSERRCTNVK